MESGKGSWREGANVRDSDRDGVSRGKHPRDDVRDERYNVRSDDVLFSSSMAVLLLESTSGSCLPGTSATALQETFIKIFV